MGIPSYFSYIIKNHSNIIQSQKIHYQLGTQFGSLFIDSNSIVYDVYNRLKSKGAILKFGTVANELIITGVIEQIKEYIKIVNPNNVLFITFDGVAPFPKIEQQRQRRCKSYMTAVYTARIKGEPFTVGNDWNTVQITPGTPFMKELTSAIKATFNNMEHIYGVSKIVVSAADVPGEGEHKIFEYIRNHKFANESIVVYGLDSDLIMLSLLHVNRCSQIFIMKEALEFSNVKRSENDSMKKEIWFLHIKEFARLLTSMLSERVNLVDGISYKSICDYILLCFFLGNDFLPHIASLKITSGGIEVLIHAYLKIKMYLIQDNGSVNMIALKKLAIELSKDEANREDAMIKKRYDMLHTVKRDMTLLENKLWMLERVGLFIGLPKRELSSDMSTYLKVYCELFRYYTEGKYDKLETAIGQEVNFRKLVEHMSSVQSKYTYNAIGIMDEEEMLRYVTPKGYYKFVGLEESDENVLYDIDIDGCFYLSEGYVK